MWYEGLWRRYDNWKTLHGAAGLQHICLLHGTLSKSSDAAHGLTIGRHSDYQSSAITARINTYKLTHHRTMYTFDQDISNEICSPSRQASTMPSLNNTLFSLLLYLTSMSSTVSQKASTWQDKPRRWAGRSPCWYTQSHVRRSGDGAVFMMISKLIFTSRISGSASTHIGTSEGYVIFGE